MSCQPFLTCSVRARFLSHQITAHSDLHVFPAVMTLKLSTRQIQSIARHVFTQHLEGGAGRLNAR
ncbi:hypothetical protein AE618_07355 [Bosea vaviloviae]|uniref:Uncharacterized protein n=1 Tax=Bosea vaviloviae TaxID=1526658 RepID=A0A0N1F670_9HYPH|nr:hypothetical protein AE618_07355 [Bosea vaviloviae]